MFIKNLTIKKNGEIIRDINFRKGINLIVDETKSPDKKESGNNVGKTTILRLIDYCLGGNGTNIYKDPEFKDEGESTVESFLKDNNVIISLTLVDNLEKDALKKVVIERNFLKGSEKIATINGESYLRINEEFSPKLNSLIFNYKSNKPTFRQIISKNIRDEKNRLKNTLKVLHPTTKSEEYESLFLFWLGIYNNSFAEKQNLENDKNIETLFQSRLKREGSLSEVKQALLFISNQISETEEKKKNNFNLNENYESDLKKLNALKSKISKFSTEISQLELRRELILESKMNLENEKSDINVENIKRFYDEAKLLLPNLQKSFDDTFNFHNQMISEKISYISEEIPELEKKIETISKEISQLLCEEKILTEKIIKLNAFDELENLIIELNKLHEQKGGLEEKEEMWKQSQAKLKEINDRLSEINESIENQDGLIQQRIAELNKSFSKISKELYGEPFILSSDKDKKGCYGLKISSISGNLGTGKKKGQIAAFDFAYIEFADSLGIDCLHFILHDQIENVHDNQITSILTNIVNGINCQYIIPVLRDKLPKEINVKEMGIISLSESEKLFKI